MSTNQCKPFRITLSPACVQTLTKALKQQGIDDGVNSLATASNDAAGMLDANGCRTTPSMLWKLDCLSHMQHKYSRELPQAPGKGSWGTATTPVLAQLPQKMCITTGTG